jgi:predicted component of type VI protein secretion system
MRFFPQRGTMPLTLTVRSAERAGTAQPPPLVLNRRGAVIGRAPGTDWTLPDERNTVSSRHCEIAYRGDAYLIADSSTNGTWVNGARLTGPHQLKNGDLIRIGPYEVAATLTAGAAATATAMPVQRAAPPPNTAGSTEQLLRAAGLDRSQVAGGDAEILAAAGAVLRGLTEGTTMLLERRARARKELGMGNEAAAAGNPLHQPGPALPRLLSVSPAAGAPPERAVATAFADLEAHQLAALKAMQGAMKATLERFSPAAIRARSSAKDDAALWQEYERAFSTGNDAFSEVFAREFRQSYEALARRSGSGG